MNQPPAMADLRQRFTKKRWRESATPWLIHAKCALLTTYAFIMTMSARSRYPRATSPKVLHSCYSTIPNSEMRYQGPSYLGRVLISHLSYTFGIKTVNYSAVEVNKIFPNTLKE